jgi:hypothetical protein
MPETSLWKASAKNNTLRTVVPMFIIEQWKLKEGDKLEWELNGEVATVKKGKKIR